MNKQRFLGGLSLIALSLMVTSCADEVVAKKGAKNYKTLTVSLSNSTIQNKYTTAIRGEQFVDIRPQVTGQITQILIKEGAAIKKGQALFIIDQVPYKAALDVASANVKSAQASVATAFLNANSSQELYNEGVISETELQISLNSLESAKAALALAEAQETNAKSDLSYTVVKSPVDGVASMIPYRVGALVSSSISDPLVSVSDNDNMYAYFSMSESQILSFTQASGSTEKFIEELPEVDLILNNGTTYSHKGSVDAISGTIDRTTGSVAIRAKFENPEQILRDGGNGSILIESQMDSVMVIPKIATFEIQDKIFVYKVIDNKTVSFEIEVYPMNNGVDYIVESGIAVGDEIIAEGAGLVRNGETVGRGDAEGQN
ncbi:MAG: efflux RND transporter periplasmic adaptor subunit [Rikenellaceae bacterium]